LLYSIEATAKKYIEVYKEELEWYLYL
jgi:hypothetical protein